MWPEVPVEDLAHSAVLDLLELVREARGRLNACQVFIGDGAYASHSLLVCGARWVAGEPIMVEVHACEPFVKVCRNGWWKCDAVFEASPRVDELLTKARPVKE